MTSAMFSSELPAWIRRGGCALKKIFAKRPHGAQTGRSIKFQQDFLFEVNRPPRPLLLRMLRSISLVAATPPDPGGEFARLYKVVLMLAFFLPSAFPQASQTSAAAAALAEINKGNLFEGVRRLNSSYVRFISQ